MADYHINIFYSEEDGGYIADIPDLDACSAFGETPEKALAEVKKAKRVWLQTAKKQGKTIPPPRYKPVIYQTECTARATCWSGKTALDSCISPGHLRLCLKR